jgi:hypothetical protein
MKSDYRVLEKESATWLSGDSEGYASCWNVQSIANSCGLYCRWVLLIFLNSNDYQLKNSSGGSSKIVTTK